MRTERYITSKKKKSHMPSLGESFSFRGSPEKKGSLQGKGGKLHRKKNAKKSSGTEKSRFALWTQSSQASGKKRGHGGFGTKTRGSAVVLKSGAPHCSKRLEEGY